MAGSLLWPTDVPDDLRLPDLDPRALLRPRPSSRRRATTSASCASTRCCRSSCWWSCWSLYARARRALHARVRGRADRHRDAARDARASRSSGSPSCRSALAAALVGPPPRRLRARLPRVGREQLVLARAACSCSSASAIVIVMALARPFRDRWWIPGAPVFVGLGLLFAFVVAVPAPGPEAAARTTRLAAAGRAARARAGRARHPGQGRGRGRVHRRAERVRGRPRADAARDPLEHAARAGRSATARCAS